MYSFLPPSILDVDPGSVFEGLAFYNARGDSINIYGSNFGGIASNVTILIGKEVCTNALWNAQSARDGDGDRCALRRWRQWRVQRSTGCGGADFSRPCHQRRARRSCAAASNDHGRCCLRLTLRHDACELTTRFNKAHALDGWQHCRSGQRNDDFQARERWQRRNDARDTSSFHGRVR